MKTIGDDVIYDRSVSENYINYGRPKNEMFLSDGRGPWLITGAFRALDMAGCLWFDIPMSIEDSAMQLNQNTDHGELLVYKRVIFVQTKDSPYYKRNYHTETPGPLRKIWRDYYFAAFSASIAYVLSNGGSSIVLNTIVGNVRPSWM